MANDYWAERQAKTQETISQKSQKEIEKQLAKYYKSALENVVGQFQLTYNTYLLNVEKGAESSPATLYKLDSYWKAQVRLKEELQKLGDRQGVLFAKTFVKDFKQIYRAIALADGGAFSEIDTETALQLINQIWCADGKTWSQRIWDNTNKLQQALNEGLLECVLNGRESKYLKDRLMDEFSVSFTRADTIVRTELAQIQTQAARQRYLDNGVKEVEVWADYDERRCDVCGKLHQKRFPVGGKMPIPAHPRCRCTLLPVIEIEPEQLSFDDIKVS